MDIESINAGQLHEQNPNGGISVRVHNPYNRIGFMLYNMTQDNSPLPYQDQEIVEVVNQSSLSGQFETQTRFGIFIPGIKRYQITKSVNSIIMRNTITHACPRAATDNVFMSKNLVGIAQALQDGDFHCEQYGSDGLLGYYAGENVGEEGSGPTRQVYIQMKQRSNECVNGYSNIEMRLVDRLGYDGPPFTNNPKDILITLEFFRKASQILLNSLYIVKELRPPALEIVLAKP